MVNVPMHDVFKVSIVLGLIGLLILAITKEDDRSIRVYTDGGLILPGLTICTVSCVLVLISIISSV